MAAGSRKCFPDSDTCCLWMQAFGIRLEKNKTDFEDTRESTDLKKKKGFIIAGSPYISCISYTYKFKQSLEKLGMW